MSFKIDELEWAFELAYEGQDDKGKYTLKLNGRKVEELDEANFENKIPPLSKSAIL